MKRLHARHPDLSNNERMMCAYLKMNLSTKEIAPLLNISVRGVETIRYRLRKKFGLEREDSLTDYLSNSTVEFEKEVLSLSVLFDVRFRCIELSLNNVFIIIEYETRF